MVCETKHNLQRGLQTKEGLASNFPTVVLSPEWSEITNFTRCKALLSFSTGCGVEKCRRRKPMMHRTLTVPSPSRIHVSFFTRVSSRRPKFKSPIPLSSTHAQKRINLNSLSCAAGLILLLFSKGQACWCNLVNDMKTQVCHLVNNHWKTEFSWE